MSGVVLVLVFLITYDTLGVAEKLVGWIRGNISIEARDFEHDYKNK